MDIFAHGFWTYAIYHRRKYAWMAVLFGVLPDILSFGIFFLTRLFSGTLERGPPPVDTIPDWVQMAYNVTHSLAVFAIVLLIVYLITKEWFWPLFGWAIHVITDFPTHSLKFFPTPIFWPFFGFRFDGISWATSWFMVLNYSAIILVFLIINYDLKRLRRKRRKD